MKTRFFPVAIVVTLGCAASPALYAADAADVSPYDKNPACMEKTTDASTGNCIVQDEGTPRHRYAPPGPSAVRNTGATGSTATGSSSSTTAPATGGRDAGRSGATR